jgi:hypothetical protein
MIVFDSGPDHLLVILHVSFSLPVPFNTLLTLALDLMKHRLRTIDITYTGTHPYD